MNEILGVKGLTFHHDKVGKPHSNLTFLGLSYNVITKDFSVTSISVL